MILSIRLLRTTSILLLAPQTMIACGGAITSKRCPADTTVESYQRKCYSQTGTVVSAKDRGQYTTSRLGNRKKQVRI